MDQNRTLVLAFCLIVLFTAPAAAASPATSPAKVTASPAKFTASPAKFTPSPSNATTSLNVQFASKSRALSLLTTRDDFTERMSAFDRSARLKTARTVSPIEMQKFVADQVREWTSAERSRIETVMRTIRGRIDSMSLPFPDTIFFAKTTGLEEGNAAYTRGNTIVLPPSMLSGDDAGLRTLICHELFHVLSRNSSVLRDNLYKAVGFHRCSEVVLPAPMRNLALTNPDAPIVEHAIRLTHNGEEVWCAPVLYSSTATYDTTRNAEFFQYLVFRLLVVQKGGSLKPTLAPLDASSLLLLDVSEVGGFFEQIGRNTGYIIHPEEILADNFALLINPGEPAPSPDVLDKMRAVLAAH